MMSVRNEGMAKELGIPPEDAQFLESRQFSKEEIAEIFSLVALGTKALSDEYGPEGFNVGMNLGKVAGAAGLEPATFW